MIREVAVFSFPLGDYTTELPRYGENTLDDEALNQAGLLIDVFNGYFLQSDSKPDDLNKSKWELLSHLNQLGSSFSHFSDNDVSSRGALPEGAFFCNHSFPGQHRYSISFHVSEHQYLLYLYVEQNPNQNYTAPLSPTSRDGSLEDLFRRSLGSVLDEPDMLSHKQFCRPFLIQRKAHPPITVNYFYPGYSIYNIYYTTYQGQIIYFNLFDNSRHVLNQFMNNFEKHITLTALYIFENHITSGNLQQYAHGYPSHTFLFDDNKYQNMYNSFPNQPMLRSHVTLDSPNNNNYNLWTRL